MPDADRSESSAGRPAHHWNDRWKPGWPGRQTASHPARCAGIWSCRPHLQAMSASRGWSSVTLLAGFVVFDGSRAVHVRRTFVIILDALRGGFGCRSVHILGTFGDGTLLG